MKAHCLQRPPGIPSRARQAHPSLSLARRSRWDTRVSWKLLLQMPLRRSAVREAFPWSWARRGSNRPRSVLSSTSAVPSHHRRLHTASPRVGPSGAAWQALGTELASDPPTPQHTRPLALPAGLHGLPPQQGDPRKDGALGPGCPERDRGRWLTNEPDGRLLQAGLSILQVRQALIQVFLSPAPALR